MNWGLGEERDCFADSQLLGAYFGAFNVSLLILWSHWEEYIQSPIRASFIPTCVITYIYIYWDVLDIDPEIIFSSELNTNNVPFPPHSGHTYYTILPALPSKFFTHQLIAH